MHCAGRDVARGCMYGNVSLSCVHCAGRDVARGCMYGNVSLSCTVQGVM